MLTTIASSAPYFSTTSASSARTVSGEPTTARRSGRGCPAGGSPSLVGREELDRDLRRGHGDQLTAAQQRERHPPARGQPPGLLVGLGADHPHAHGDARFQIGVFVLGEALAVERGDLGALAD